jgi:hypothetical protein
MASDTTTGSNIDIVREHTERVFNQHSPDLAAKYLAPGVTWHRQTVGTIKGADSVTAMLRGFIGYCPTCAWPRPGRRGVGRRQRDGDLVSSRRVHAAVARGFKANRRGRSRVIRIAVAGQGKASGGLAATGAAPISFADLASKSASARK